MEVCMDDDFVSNEENAQIGSQVITKMENEPVEAPKVKLSNDLCKLNRQNIQDCIKLEIKASVVIESTNAKIAADVRKNKALAEFLEQKSQRETAINNKLKCESASWVMLEKEMNNTGVIKNTLTRDIENLEDEIKCEIYEKRKLETEINDSLNSFNQYKGEVTRKRIENQKNIKEKLWYLDESKQNYLIKMEELKQEQGCINSSIDEIRCKTAALKRQLGEMLTKRDERKTDLNYELARQESIKNDIDNIPLEELKQKQLSLGKNYKDQILAYQQKFDESYKRFEEKLSELTEMRNVVKENAARQEELAKLSIDVTSCAANEKIRCEELQKNFENAELHHIEVLNERLAKQEKCNDLNAKLVVINEEVSAMKNRARELKIQNEIASSKFNTLTITKQQLETQINKNKLIFERERELKNLNLEDLESRCAQVREKLSERINDMEVQNKKHDRDRNECKAKVDDMKRESEQKLKSLEDKCANLKMNSAALLAQHEANNENLERLEKELTSAKDDLNAHKCKLNDINDRVNEKILHRDSLDEQLKNLDENIASIEQGSGIGAGRSSKTENVANLSQPAGILKSNPQVAAASKQVTFEPGLKGDSESSAEIGGNNDATVINKQMELFDALFRTSPPVRERSIPKRYNFD